MDQQATPGKNTGKFMAIMSWLLVMAMLTWFFASVEEEQSNPNQEISSYQRNGSTEVVLERNRWGHYVAPGFINGKPVTFMVDTGATHVAIPLHLQHELGLTRGMAVPINTANGKSKAYLTKIPTLSLGALTFHDVQGGLAPGMENNEILLGMSVLADLTMTQQGNQLILKK